MNRFALGLFICFALFFHGLAQDVSAQKLPKILLLHSYHAGYKWTEDITQAIQGGLTDSSRVDLRIEYLDTKRYASAEYLTLQRKYLSEKYSYTTFDVVLCADNSALLFLLANRDNIFPGVPIVFCGINSYNKELLKGHSNITGVAENVDIKQTIDLMLTLHPETKNIVVVNDHTVTGTLLQNEIQKISKEYENVDWEFPEYFDFNELRLHLSLLKPGDLVLLGVFFRDINNRPIEYDEAATTISESAPVPVYGLWDFYLGHGIIGGYLASGYAQGEMAVKLARQILSGKNADDIEVITKSPNRYFIDYRAVKRFENDDRIFPSSTTIINRPEDLYTKYKSQIWSAIVLVLSLSLFSFFLFLAVIKKRIAEKKLRKLTADLESRVQVRTRELSKATEEISNREKQMQHLLSNLSGMAYRCSNDEQWTMTYVSDGVIPLTGYNKEEILNNAKVAYADIIDRRDLETANRIVAEGIEKEEHFTLEYRIITKDRKIKWVWEQGVAIYNEQGDVLYLNGFITDISERKKYEMEQTKLATAVHHADEIIFITDLEGIIEYVNPAFEKISGYSASEAVGRNPRFLKSGKQPAEFYDELWQTLLAGKVWRGKLANRTKDNKEYLAEVSLSPIKNHKLEYTNYVAVQRDITTETILENSLRQSQKLEALGTLAGGIAHEINTPAQFVGTNISFILESIPDLDQFVRQCTDFLNSAPVGPQASSLTELYRENDIEYLLKEIPLALQQSEEGISQVSNIVRSMKQFAHPGEENKVPCDINDAIQNTVTVCANEWRYVANITFDLADNLPMVPCHRSEMNQVMLNIIVNAAHSIAHKWQQKEEKGVITIQSKIDDQFLEISVRDNGEGLPESIKEKIFDPFFTTKAPGQGTGQGLSIAHSVVTEKHQGELFFESAEGEGATFIIRLPIISEKK